MYVPEPHLMRRDATPQMFADLILDVLPHYRVLRDDSSFASIPFDMDPNKPLMVAAETQMAVDGLLSLIRQTQVKSEDVACERLFKFVEAKQMPESNRNFMEWVRIRLEHSALPTEAEVELEFGAKMSSDEQEYLLASSRYVAALHLYGRLVHRKYLKRLHLGHLIKTLGEQLVFDKCAQHAEFVAGYLINLAQVWRAADLGLTLRPAPTKPGVWITYPDDELTHLAEFLKPFADELNQGDGRRWCVPF